MTKADQNLMVIQNFILYATHSSSNEGDENFRTQITLTPEELYQMAEDYIDEDHVDGRDFEENNIEL